MSLFEKLFKKPKELQEFEELQKKENIPSLSELSEVKEIKEQEFRNILETQRTKEVFVNQLNIDDFGAWGYFYIRLEDGSWVKTTSYLPVTDRDGRVTDDVIVLRGLSYKEVVLPKRLTSIIKFSLSE